MNTSHLFLSGCLWGGLLISSCAYISPALGGQDIASTSSVEPATHLSVSPISVSPNPLLSLDSAENFSGTQIVNATSTVPNSVPTFWASQSLARLMDQHDCPPQSSANVPLSIDGGIGEVNRYRIAAQLFSCLEHWDRQAFDTQEQATLKALRAEFKLELVALQGYSASDPMLRSIKIPPDSIGSHFRLQNSNVAVNVPVSTPESNPAKYSQSIDIASQGRMVLGVNYTDQALGAPGTILGIDAEASLGKIGLFGRYSAALGTQSGRTDRNLDNLLDDRSIQSWTAGVGIHDFMIHRSVLAVSVSRSIQPSNLTQSAQTNYSAFYQFPLTERLTLSPSLVIMTDSEKAGTAPDIQGALQASFAF